MLNDDDMVAFDYDLFVDGKLRETSNAARAVENKIHRRGQPYKPLLFTVGIGQIIPGLEQAIREQAIEKLGQDEPFRVKVPAEQAYGKRNKDLILTVPIARFKGQAIQVGSRVQMNGREGTVFKIGGGRATIDFHHDLAGKDLEYNLWVRSIYREPVPKANAIIDRALAGEANVSWTEEDGLVVMTVRVPDGATMNPQWLMEGRPSVVGRIRHAFVGKPVRVVFIETYNPPPAPPTVVVEQPEPPAPQPAP